MADTMKVTKKTNFTEIANFLDASGKTDLADVMRHEIELLERKSANASKHNADNDGIKADILSVLAVQTAPISVSNLIATKEMQNFANAYSGDGNNPYLSNQKISSMLGDLIEDGKVVKSKDKKTSVFSLAE